MSLYNGLKSSIEAIKTVSPSLESAKELKSGFLASGQAAKDALSGVGKSLKPVAQNKMVQRGIFPAIVGGSVGIGSYAGMKGVGAGLRELPGPDDKKSQQRMATGMAYFVGLVAVVVLAARYWQRR